MTERELRERFDVKLELPAIVEERMGAAYAQVRKNGAHTMKKQNARRSIRALLVLAAVIAALGIGATGVYMVTRTAIVLPSIVPALEGLFGNEGRPSTEGRTGYYEERDLIYDLPDEERVSLDDQAAIAIFKDYLPEAAYAWQVGEYIFTVESYLLDEGAGMGKIYYSLARKGGVEGLTIDPAEGVWCNGEGISLVFRSPVGEMPPLNYRTYLDEGRTTEDKMFFALSFVNTKECDASDGVRIEFCDKPVKTEKERLKNAEILFLPGIKSLPNTVINDSVTGAEVIQLSAIGMIINTPNGEEPRYVALDYADGIRYVVSDRQNNIRNTNYELIAAHSEAICYCFNRLVDPSQVVSVTVDGHVYTAKQ